MADKTTTLHLRMTDGLSAAALKAARSMHGVSQAADKLANKRLRVGGLDQVAAQARRVNLTMLSMERDLERAVQRRVTALQRAEKARQAEAAAAARAAEAERRHNSFRARAGRFAAGAGAVGAGAVAAGHVVAPRVQKAVSYDLRKARLATTMAGDGTVGDMQKAHAQIGDAVYRAVREGGGSRDEALAGLDALVSSGKFEGRAALDALPSIVKTAWATGAEPEHIAKSAAAMIEAGVAAKDLQRGFDMMLKGGRVGAFELPDMARWMPQQLALAKTVGLSGLDAVRQIVAANEVARATAGTSDETGNNVVNLLQKLTSRELKDTMAKTVDPKAGDPTTPGKVKGKGAKARRAPATFDWSKFMVQRQLQGVNPLDAFAEVLDRQMQSSDDYKALTAKLATTKDEDERKQLIASAAKIAEGSEIGKILADRQALMAALALRYGAKLREEILGQLDKSSGDTERTSQFIRGTTGSQVQDAANALDRANEQSVGAISGPMGVLAQRVSEAADAFPKLTSAIYGITTLGTGLAAGGAGAALWFKLFGGGAAGAAGTGGAAAPAAGGATGGAAAATGARSFLRSGLRGGLLGGAIYGAGTAALDYGFGMFPGNYPVGYDPAKEKNLGILDRLDRIINGYKKMPAQDPKAAAEAAYSRSRIEETFGVEENRTDPRLGATAPMPPSRPGGASAPLPPVRPPDLKGDDSAAAQAGNRMADAFGDALKAGLARAQAEAQAQVQAWASSLTANVSIRVTPRVDGAQLRANHADSGVY
ncbi:phage tail tape measure protein [Camelimonas lactis]|uniref:Minor tail protein n=1 Tax=Camelimonas lactis TaxID=659006 RepID=A0A4R2GGW6_9HYPH|nr:phage tail tape measure protein [Camelimonas lactis]TCO07601.1 minor tail protein [Camelimonas lactis]